MVNTLANVIVITTIIVANSTVPFDLNITKGLSRSSFFLNGINARAINNKIEFIYDFDARPVLHNCDEKYLARAFLNLIENCLRYAKKNIFIRCKYIDDYINISIEDDGEGISKEDLPHIFNRFYKGEGGKHGIGLSIVESIVIKHNGSIEASNSDIGAVFTIKFPTY